MDRRCKTGALIVLAWLIAQSAAALPAASGLRDSRWLPPERQLEALTTQPPECVRSAATLDAAKRLSIGRAAFRSSMLLGGQAARAGVSCNTCHRNGHGNPDFHFPGLSGTYGTADVTSSVMSSHREDGIFNPVSIPDLSGPVSSFKVSRSEHGKVLREFIRDLIVEEFDGAEPSALTLDSVTLYVRSLSADACQPSSGNQPVSLKRHAEEVRGDLRAALFAIELGDKEAARLMLLAAREGLASIYERYSASGLARERRLLRNASRRVARIQGALESGHDVELLIAGALQDRDWETVLQRKERSSLFAPEELAVSSGR